MASNNPAWEVVGKTTKKGKSHGHNLSKTQKKAMADNMPRIEVAPPVKESPTIYDAFIDKSERPVQSNSKDDKPVSPKAGSKKQPQKKQKTQEKRDQKQTLEEAVSMIDANEMETLLLKDQATFPENPGIWLKDLASMLNLQLDKIPEGDPVFSGKPADFPSSLLTNKVRKLLTNTLNQCTEKMLELFFEHCVQSMVNDLGKGIPTHGYRIFMQLLVRNKPEIISGNLNKYVEMMKANQSRPLRCLSIMWAVGQAGRGKLSTGIKVWLEALVPLLNVRGLSVYVVDYLDDLFREHENIRPAYNTIDFRSFFPILDFIFASNSSLPTNLQKKLHTLYPKLKEISFGADPSNRLRHFFPNFLVRLTPKANQDLKKELLDCLTECLAVDKQCFSVWRQIYTKELANSSLLLKHLVENWGSISRRVDRNVMKETITAFSITNEEVAAQEQGGGDGYTQCVTACKELLVKMSTPRFPWRLLFFIAFASVAGLISYDSYKAGSFKKSQTAKLLEQAGILVFLEQVWQRITIYANKALVWLQQNVPYYYSKTCDFVGPYLTLFWQKLYEFGVYLAAVTKPVRDWLHEKIPQLLEWIQGKLPGLAANISYYLGGVWAFVVQYSLWLWQHIAHYAHVTGMWLQENVFTGKLSGENIQKALSSSLAVVQSYSSAALQWIIQLLYSSQ